MLADRGIGVREDHPLLGQVLLQRTVHDLALELGFDAGQELPLGLRNAEFFERVLDGLGHFVPGTALAVGRLQVVVEILEIDVELSAPGRHRLGVEDPQRLQAELAHPRGLAFQVRDLVNNVRVQALAGFENRLGLGAEVVFVDFADLVVRRKRCDISSHRCDPLAGWQTEVAVSRDLPSGRTRRARQTLSNSSCPNIAWLRASASGLALRMRS